MPQMTSFHARMCLLGVRKTKFHTLTPFPQKTEIMGEFLTKLKIFQLIKALAVAMLIRKLPLIIIIAP